MNKKAFTLIELIMVIVILGVIAMIAVPTVNSIIKDSKKKAYDEQIALITDTAKTYMSKYDSETGTNNSLKLPKDTSSSYCLTIETIKKSGLLSNENIQNPNYVAGSSKVDEKTKIFNGAVKITWNGKKYKYEYKDSATCA